MKNDKKYLYNGSYEGMTGIILESRGGANIFKIQEKKIFKYLLLLRNMEKKNIKH